MPKTYSRMPDECKDRVNHLLKCFHPDLVAAGVTFDLLSVSTDGDGAPLSHQGYPAAAVVRVTNVKERTKGAADVEIVFDEEHYLTLSDPERDAIIDHEIYHVEVKINPKTERVKLDCRGRPKLGMRKHDVQIGHFVAIAERHGPASMEVKQMTRIFLTHRQTLFEFALGESTRLALDAATAGPSDKVREVAREIMSSSPAVQAAARNLVSSLRKNEVTMTMRSGGKETTIA